MALTGIGIGAAGVLLGGDADPQAAGEFRAYAVSVAADGLPLSQPPTPTPTKTIVAKEATPVPGTGSGTTLWAMDIKSDTKRQYTNLDNGAVGNTCSTNWSVTALFVVTPGGNVEGKGDAKLVTAACSPIPDSAHYQLQTMQFTIRGSANSDAMDIQLVYTDGGPVGTLESGGMMLLFNSGTCPPTDRPLHLPAPSSTAAPISSNLSGQMTGCAGSAKDTLTASNVVTLTYGDACVGPTSVDEFYSRCYHSP